MTENTVIKRIGTGMLIILFIFIAIGLIMYGKDKDEKVVIKKEKVIVTPTPTVIIPIPKNQFVPNNATPVQSQPSSGQSGSTIINNQNQGPRTADPTSPPAPTQAPPQPTQPPSLVCILNICL